MIIFQVKNSGYQARTMYSVLTKFLGMVMDKTETLHKILNPSFILSCAVVIQEHGQLSFHHNFKLSYIYRFLLLI